MSDFQKPPKLWIPLNKLHRGSRLTKTHLNKDELLRLAEEEKRLAGQPIERPPYRLLNVEQVSNLIGVKRSTIYYWIHKGIIPHVKLPGAVRFELPKIMEWIETRRKGLRPQPPSSEIATRILKDRR